MVFLLHLAAVLAAGLFVALAWTSSLRAGVARSLIVVACAFAYHRLLEPLSQNVDSFRGERIQSRSVPPSRPTSSSRLFITASWPFWPRSRLLEVVPSASGG
jgi:hypothetical protein